MAAFRRDCLAQCLPPLDGRADENSQTAGSNEEEAARQKSAGEQAEVDGELIADFDGDFVDVDAEVVLPEDDVMGQGGGEEWMAEALGAEATGQDGWEEQGGVSVQEAATSAQQIEATIRYVCDGMCSGRAPVCGFCGCFVYLRLCHCA